MVKFKHRGDFNKTKAYMITVKKNIKVSDLDKYGREGVAALSEATPKDTGLTAASWEYEVVKEEGRIKIIWSNTNVNDYVNIALILQYGHATGNGSYVQGVDYINPAMAPIFDKIADKAWKEITK